MKRGEEMKTAFIKDDFRYTFNYSDYGKDNFLLLVKTGIKTDFEKVFIIPVIENPGYAWKINKKSVSAAGGAYGLMKYIKRCIDDDFCMCYVNRIIAAVCNW